MPIVNINNMLQKALREGYAILHANVVNIDMARAIIMVASQTNSPIIVAVSEKALKGFAGCKEFADSIRQIVSFNKIRVPVAIHLDHGEYQTVLSAIDNGFTSVMYDGSKLPLKQNLQNTKFIVKLAHAKNISVECEVGTVLGKQEDKQVSGQLANVNECIQMANTNIDALAAGIGNLHGKYPLGWKGLNFQRLEEIHNVLPRTPLVLHGGSGIPKKQIKQSIKLGVAKFNIGTELLVAFTNGIAPHFIKEKYKYSHGYDPREYFPQGYLQLQKVISEKLKFLGSLGKA